MAQLAQLSHPAKTPKGDDQNTVKHSMYLINVSSAVLEKPECVALKWFSLGTESNSQLIWFGLLCQSIRSKTHNQSRLTCVRFTAFLISHLYVFALSFDRFIGMSSFFVTGQSDYFATGFIALN